MIAGDIRHAARQRWGVLVLVFLATLVSGRAVQADTDPGALHEIYLAAVNSGDTEAVTALYAPDGEFLGGGGCSPEPCRGSTAIRLAYETLVAQHTQITLLEQQVDGDVLHATTEFRNDLVQHAGVDRIISNVTLEVSGDQISALRAEPDLTDDQTVRFIQFLSGPRP